MPTINDRIFFDTSHLDADLKGRALRGGTVMIMGQVINNILRIGTTPILARLLTPGDYGVIAMVGIVVGFVGMFKDLGLSMATIQREGVSHEQVSTLFWVNLVVSIVLMLLVFALAPWVARFYGQPKLVPVTIVLAATFIFGGLTVQHQALLRRQMRFKALVSIEVASVFTSIVTGILLARFGAGYWALVFMQWTHLATTAAGVWLMCRWRPGRPTRYSGVRSMLAFGGNITGFTFTNYFAGSLDKLALGRVWGEDELGYYAKANQLVLMPFQMISSPIGPVALPLLCRLQNDPERYRAYYLKCIRLLSFVTVPSAVFVILMAYQITSIMLGDQWVKSAQIISVLGAFGIIMPICHTMGWHYIASGTTYRMFRWGIFDLIMIMFAVALGLPHGAVGMATAIVLMRYAVFVPQVWYGTRCVSVSVGDVLNALSNPFMGAICMGATIFLLKLFILQDVEAWISVIVCLCVGSLVYLGTISLINWSIAPVLELPNLLMSVYSKRKEMSS